jgi:hypothetical protein
LDHFQGSWNILFKTFGAGLLRGVLPVDFGRYQLLLWYVWILQFFKVAVFFDSINRRS